MKDLKQVAAELREDYIREHVGQLDAIVADLESPLEVAVLWALALHSPSIEATGCPCFAPGRANRRDGASVIIIHSAADPIEIAVWPQLEVEANHATYRLDFGLVATLRQGGGAVAGQAFVDLELDGHDYHERTKEQAERDKKRDRDLQSIGWNVARFTGSQVFRDAAGVAGEAIGFASGLAWRAAGLE